MHIKSVHVTSPFMPMRAVAFPDALDDVELLLVLAEAVGLADVDVAAEIVEEEEASSSPPLSS